MLVYRIGVTGRNTMSVKQQDPKYLDLAKQLRADLQTGRLKPGDRLPSFVELRNEHRVSRGTVEKVHALLERDGLIVREQGRGVFVAPQRRAVTNGIIGFSGGGFSEARHSQFWAHLLDGIQQEGSRRRVQLLLMTETSDHTIWNKIDGLLLSVNDEDVEKNLRNMPDGLPCVSVLHEADAFSHVIVDDYQAAKDATDHLLELGHRKIAHLISGHERLVEHRLEGYRVSLQESGIEAGLLDVRRMYLRTGRDSKSEFAEQGYAAMRKWLQSDWRELGYTAIIAQNDNAAVGAINAFKEAGLRVPEDVSVVGFDGNEMYDYFTPRLTTVEVPVQEIGSTAVRLLVERIAKPDAAIERITAPATLKVGASTGPAPR